MTFWGLFFTAHDDLWSFPPLPTFVSRPHYNHLFAVYVYHQHDLLPEKGLLKFHSLIFTVPLSSYDFPIQTFNWDHRTYFSSRRTICHQSSDLYFTAGILKFIVGSVLCYIGKVSSYYCNRITDTTWLLHNERLFLQIYTTWLSILNCKYKWGLN